MLLPCYSVACNILHLITQSLWKKSICSTKCRCLYLPCPFIMMKIIVGFNEIWMFRGFGLPTLIQIELAHFCMRTDGCTNHVQIKTLIHVLWNWTYLYINYTKDEWLFVLCGENCKVIRENSGYLLSSVLLKWVRSSNYSPRIILSF